MNSIRKPQVANLFFLPFILLLLLYWDTVAGLFRTWADPDNAGYSHGVLLLVISAIIFYREWNRQVKSLDISVNGAWLLLLLGMSLIWFLADLVFVQVIKQLSFILLIALLLLSLFSFNRVARLMVAVLLMITAIPVWDMLGPYLQYVTAISSEMLLRLGGIPLVREGYFILIPSGTFEVEEACSGLHFLAVGVSLAIIYAYVDGVKFRAGLVYVAIATVLAILANILRVTTVVLVGYLTDMKHPIIEDHDWVGWVFFAVLIVVFVWLTNRLKMAKGTVNGDVAAVDSNASCQRVGVESKALFAIVLSMVCLAVGPVLAFAYIDRGEEKPEGLVHLPDTVAGWSKVVVKRDTWQPVVNKGDFVSLARYGKAGQGEVSLFVSLFYKQSQGREAIDPANRAYNSPDWIAESTRMLSPQETTVPFHDVKESVIRSRTGTEKLVWQWYYVAESRTAGNYSAKVANAIARLRGESKVAVFVLAVDLDQSREQAQATLNVFVTQALAEIEQTLRI